MDLISYQTVDPRPYQAEAFDAARKDNIVMIGATGVGKTLVSLMLIRDYYFQDSRRKDPLQDDRVRSRRRWCVFLCPTQELVFQQTTSAQIYTGVRCGAYVGRDLDYWGIKKWRQEIALHEVLVMTPNALLNLLHRGREYLSLEDVGVLVFDECHKARKRHPYARVMAFYQELHKNGRHLPKVFGMTASPTVECVAVLHCKAYVCEDREIEMYQANADWEVLHYQAFHPSRTVWFEVELLLKTLFARNLIGFMENMSKFEDNLLGPVRHSYYHLGLWCAIRHVVAAGESEL
ncbi:unnamed protein product [Discosporangium mesarthrocarpum]